MWWGQRYITASIDIDAMLTAAVVNIACFEKFFRDETKKKIEHKYTEIEIKTIGAVSNWCNSICKWLVLFFICIGESCAYCTLTTRIENHSLISWRNK
jgi:hypothetical protein